MSKKGKPWRTSAEKSEPTNELKLVVPAKAAESESDSDDDVEAFIREVTPLPLPKPIVSQPDDPNLILRVASQTPIIESVARYLANILNEDCLGYAQLPLIMAAMKLNIPIATLRTNLSRSIVNKLSQKVSNMGNFDRYHLILVDYSNKKKASLLREREKASMLLDEYSSLPDSMIWKEFMQKVISHFIMEHCSTLEMGSTQDPCIITKIVQEQILKTYELSLPEIIILAPLRYKPLNTKHLMVPIIGSNGQEHSNENVLMKLG